MFKVNFSTLYSSSVHRQSIAYALCPRRNSTLAFIRTGQIEFLLQLVNKFFETPQGFWYSQTWLLSLNISQITLKVTNDHNVYIKITLKGSCFSSHVKKYLEIYHHQKVNEITLLHDSVIPE